VAFKQTERQTDSNDHINPPWRTNERT